MALESSQEVDFVVVDCQPTLGVLPVNAMVAANHFLIPAQPSGYALRGLGDLLETLHGVQRFSTAGDYRILLTMVMAQAKVTNGMVERALEPLREKLLRTQIARREILNRFPLRSLRPSVKTLVFLNFPTLCFRFRSSPECFFTCLRINAVRAQDQSLVGLWRGSRRLADSIQVFLHRVECGRLYPWAQPEADFIFQSEQ